jgi:hypothetical protein
MFLASLLCCTVLSTCRSTQLTVLKAQQFVLVDSNGQTRGGLVFGPNGPTLELYDSQKTLRVLIRLQ